MPSSHRTFASALVALLLAAPAFAQNTPPAERVIRMSGAVPGAAGQQATVRFAIYDAETKPILDYYAGDKVVNIDASQSPARVLHEILGHIVELDAWKAIEAMKV